MFDYEATARYYDELENKLYMVSGYTVSQLIKLFAAGCTLQPPKNESISTLDLLTRLVMK